MSLHILEGGTDVAKMAIFCTDSMPDKQPDYETIKELEDNNKLIVLSTEADGGYLLHLYIDEEIDTAIKKYCSKTEIIKSKIIIKKGNISFGGLESAFFKFKPNKNIRCDSKVESGLYNVTLYQTEYPDELIEEKMLNEVGKKNIKHNLIPSYVLTIGFFISVILLVLSANSNIKFGLALIALVFTIYIWFKKYIHSSKYLKIEKKIHEVNNCFPSIIGVMKKA